MSPMMARQVTDDRDGLLTFLAKQRDAVRAAVHGLDEERARTRCTDSELTLATLLKHVIRTERRWVVVQMAQQELPGLWPMTDPGADFSLEEGETLAGLLADYRVVDAETEKIVDSVEDLDRPLPIPEAVRHIPGVEPYSARWVLLHLIEETARHAGHADILRESLDGARAHELVSAHDAGQD